MIGRVIHRSLIVVALFLVALLATAVLLPGFASSISLNLVFFGILSACTAVCLWPSG
jgi:hypothetical protein